MNLLAIIMNNINFQLKLLSAKIFTPYDFMQLFSIPVIIIIIVRVKVKSKVMRCSRYGNRDRMHVILRSSSRICLIALRFQLFIAFTERKKEVPFSMAIGNGELMHECFPKNLRMGTR